MKFEASGILITGASRGLGAALARALSSRGARLALVARDARPLDEVVHALRASGAEAHAIPADVGDQHAVYPLVGAANALVGPIELLIHNASTLGPTPLRSLLDTECEDFARVLEVNLLGPFRISKAVAGAMAVRGSGTILHISSDASVEAYESWGAYSISKAGLDHMTRIWASELADSGVRFLSVDPGEMDTEMHAAAIPDADRSELNDPDTIATAIIRLLEAKDVVSGSRHTAQQWRTA